MKELQKKRKIDAECRVFKDKWGIDYFFVYSNKKAICVICNKSVAVLKEYNMQRHYDATHKWEYSKYYGNMRTEKFNLMKRNLSSMQGSFTQISNQKESITKASFRLYIDKER